MIKLKDLLNEMPHVDYDSTSDKPYKNKLIDFNFEKMNISQNEKQELLKYFLSNGIIGNTNKNKYILFTRDSAHFIDKNKIKKYKLLPNDWAKYITIFDS